jgi:polar amino acid transport system substrate-binding protein
MDDGESNSQFAATARDRWVTLVPQPAISKQGIAFGLRRVGVLRAVEALNYFIEEKGAIGEIQKISQGFIDKLAARIK